MSPDPQPIRVKYTTSDGLDTPADESELPCCPPGEEPDEEQLPSRAVDALVMSAKEIETAERQAAEVIDDLCDGIATDLGAHQALMDQVCDEMVGAVDLALSAQEDKAVKIVATLFRDVDRELERCVGWCLDVGIKPPYHPAEQSAALQGDWLQMLMDAVPTVAGALVQPATVTGEDYSDGAYSESPTPAGGSSTGGLVVGYGAPVYPVVGGGNTPLGGAQAPPGSPPAAGSVTTTTTTTADGDDITVNVYLPPPPAAPPAAPPPTGLPPGLGTGGEPNRPAVPPGGSYGAVPQIQTIPGYVPPPPVAPMPKIGDYVPGFGYVTPQGFSQTPPPATAAPLYPAPVPVPKYEPPAKETDYLLGFPLGSSLPQRAPNESQINAVNWDSPEACKQASSLARAPAQNLAAPAKGEPKSFLEHYLEGKLQWQNWLGVVAFPLFIPLELKQLADAWAKSETGKSAAADEAIYEIAQTTVLGNLGPQAVPNRAAALFFGGKLGAARWVEGKTNFPLEYLMTSDLYLYQHANPQYLPNQVRVDDAFLNNQISGDLWECWTKANGNLTGPASKVMMSNATKPEINDLITLFRRGHMSRDVLTARMRERGVVEPGYVQEYLAATIALPTQSDLVRFMVRDSADDSVAKLYGYDTDFTEKYTPQIQAWAKSLGLDETYFRYMWRSHWEIPSYTQLSEMFHRLRPDRPEVREWDEQASIIGPVAHELGYGPRPRIVTRDDIKEALEINDLAPAWVQPMIDIAYNPITRTDAVRAYMIGAFTDDQLREAFLDVGYSPRSADTLLEYHRQDRARRRANVTGTWTVRRITSYYKSGRISRSKAEQLMEPLTANKAEIKATLDSADDETAADTRGVAIAGVRRGMMVGEHSTSDAARMLLTFGVDPIAADRLITNWTIQRDTRYKQISAAEASRMLSKGLISAEQFRKRMRNLGYSITDADLMTARALKVEIADDGATPDELDKAIGAAIRNRKAARKLSDATLSGRLRQLLAEVARIQAEQASRGGAPQPTAPDDDDDGG